MFADKRNQFFSGVRAEVHKIEEREQIQSFEFLSSALWLKSWIWPDLATTKKDVDRDEKHRVLCCLFYS